MKGALIFKPTGKKIWDALEHEPSAWQGTWRTWEEMEDVSNGILSPDRLTVAYRTATTVQCLVSSLLDSYIKMRLVQLNTTVVLPSFNGKHDVDEHSPKSKFGLKAQVLVARRLASGIRMPSIPTGCSGDQTIPACLAH